MNPQTVKLFDQFQKVLATAQVAHEGDRYGGTIDLQSMPDGMRALFDEFEEIVNGQMLSFLDEIQVKIGAIPIKAVFDNGYEAFVKDLQIYPSTGDISFKFSEIPAQSAKLA